MSQMHNCATALTFRLCRSVSIRGRLPMNRTAQRGGGSIAAAQRWRKFAVAAGMAAALAGSSLAAENTRIAELVSSVVRLKTHINPDGRTVEFLGREREGSGIVIDADGLVLTIGYLMVEAYAAEVEDNSAHVLPANVVGYDHETGFGLLRTIEPLKLKPMPLGKSSEVK